MTNFVYISGNRLPNHLTTYLQAGDETQSQDISTSVTQKANRFLWHVWTHYKRDCSITPHASTKKRERKRRQKNMFDSLLSLSFFLELSFTLSQSSLSLLSISLPTISSLFLSLLTLYLLYSLLFSLSHSFSYSRLSYSLSLLLSLLLSPLLSFHSLSTLFIAFSPLLLSLLSPSLFPTLTPILSLSYSVSPTLSRYRSYFLLLSLSLPPSLFSLSLSLLLCLSYSLSSSLHSPLFLSPRSLTLCPLSPSVCLCRGLLWG